MKLPEEVARLLASRFRKKKSEWLEASVARDGLINDAWPLLINLDIPDEKSAVKQAEAVRAWAKAWKQWSGAGTLEWVERKWKALGTQRLPARFVIGTADDVARWAGESVRWDRAKIRFANLVNRWPMLTNRLSKYFDVLADYSEGELERLVAVIDWIVTHPNSNLFPRQLPIAGLDTKWLDSRKGLLSELVHSILNGSDQENDFYKICGLRELPKPIRFRVLDAELRSCFGGLEDLTIPLEQAAALELPARVVFIVENIQTGLAFTDLPGAMVIMGLGYNVDGLSRLGWLARAEIFYWGDLDTHGFAILNRVRAHLPKARSILMDEKTLMAHSDMWVKEEKQYGAEVLPLLTEQEQTIYRGIRDNLWEQSIRLEQERVAWDYAWDVLKKVNLTIL